ncbi:MAG TPA: tryptophan-rich sensory protein [Flavobacterium sp.]|uniref:TspO/MBR family protein n=1 Tax=Flavobacterium sp. TaxID=239 RepID=UPI002CAD9166|nr:TspO/MBR family protein [Flavobacterium sp.]HNP31765.1 tryptophan-rich sensory protein [Flavobacterium sp.]
MQKIIKIVLVVLVCVSLGFLSGMVTRDSVTTWYPTLIKPFFNPPNWIFAPVWTLLYIMMGIAAGLVWTSDSDEKAIKKALGFFVIQFGLNALWSYIFFGLHNTMLALIEIIVLLLLIYDTYTAFKKIDKTAGMLLLPYLAWVGFATILNASIWWLN